MPRNSARPARAAAEAVPATEGPSPEPKGPRPASANGVRPVLAGGAQQRSHRRVYPGGAVTDVQTAHRWFTRPPSGLSRRGHDSSRNRAGRWPSHRSTGTGPAVTFPPRATSSGCQSSSRRDRPGGDGANDATARLRRPSPPEPTTPARPRPANSGPELRHCRRRHVRVFCTHRGWGSERIRRRVSGTDTETS